VTKPFDPAELRARIRGGRTVIELQARVAERMQEFEDYVEHAPLGILVVEQDGSIEFANDSACSTFGYQADELQGQRVEILIPDCLRERHVALRQAYFEDAQPRVMARRPELFGRRKDDRPVPLAISLNPIQRGPTPRVACTVMDLTDLHQAEQQLQRFFDLSMDLFVIAHVDGTILRANAKYGNLLGYSEEEVLARPFFDFINPDDIPAVRAQIQRLIAGETVSDFRCRARDILGNDHWIEWNARAIPEDGTLYAVGRNITERLRLENELLYRQTRERAILDHMPALIYVKGTDGRYQFVNWRHAELISGNPETAIGKSIRDFLPEEEALVCVEHDRRIVETGEGITVEEIRRHADGDHIYISLKFPLLDSSGCVCATAGISTDITEQIRARRTNEELTLARSFQGKLYPRNAPAVCGIDVAGSATALAQLCGDYYDYIGVDPKRLMVSIADVSGHGIAAALQMAQTRGAVRGLARRGLDLSLIMSELNHMLCEDLPESFFVSFFLAEIDVETQQLHYVGAGHDAILIRADGSDYRLKSTHPLLGIDAAVAFPEHASLHIGHGDVLLLFTDGLTEAMSVDGAQYGRQRAAETVCRHRQESAGAILHEIFRSVNEFIDGQKLSDDITLLVVKFVE
jgi:sigma-B regulation protein RsbU (phosphoserine phosphatase)